MSLVILNRKGAVRIAVAYFEPPATLPPCDVLRLENGMQMPTDTRWRCSQSETLLIDLRQPDTDLLAGMNETTRYHMRRAQKSDDLKIVGPIIPDAGLLARFETAFREFALTKGLTPPPGEFYRQLVAQRGLYLSYAGTAAFPELVYHAHLVCGRRARLLHSSRSATLDKNLGTLGGRANRLLHWLEICAFRQEGCTEYDFGGICLEEDKPELVGISRFKMGFGGRIVPEYKGLLSRNLLGRLAVAAHAWQKRRETRHAAVPGVASRAVPAGS